MDAHAEDFCKDTYPLLVAILTARGASRADAEDLAQDTLVRVVQHWGKVCDAPHPRAWAIRVALNLSVSKWRRAGAEARALARLTRRRTAHMVVDASREDDGELVEALRRLPPRQRTAVALRFIGDLSVAGTADAMGCREGTVKSLTAQGLAALRELLEPPPSPSMCSPIGRSDNA